MGSAVVDVFGLELGSDTGPARRETIEKAVLEVVPRPAPKKPDEPSTPGGDQVS